MTSTKSAQTIDYLAELFALFGNPCLIVSDNGPQLTSAEFDEFLSENGIRHLTTAPYNPSSNGQAENFVRSFKAALGKMLPEGARKKDTHTAARTFLQDYRASPHSTTGQTPASMFLRRELCTPLEMLLNNQSSSPSAPAAARQPRTTPPQPSIFEEGQKIWFRKQQNQKWMPGTITKALGQAMFRIQPEGEGDQRSEELHINQIRKRHQSERHRPTSNDTA